MPNQVGRPEGGSRIDDIRLIQLRREGKSRRFCANEFGVTEGAIKFAEARIKKSLTLPPLGENELNKNNIDSAAQLVLINETVLGLLERCKKMVDREEIKMAALDAISKKVAKSPRDLDAQETLNKIWAANTKATIAIQENLINVSGEVRKQIELQIKIAETMYNIQVMAEFQSELVGLLRETDPIVAQKFINKLKERRTIRGLIKSIV